MNLYAIVHMLMRIQSLCIAFLIHSVSIYVANCQLYACVCEYSYSMKAMRLSVFLKTCASKFPQKQNTGRICNNKSLVFVDNVIQIKRDSRCTILHAQPIKMHV